MAKPYFTRPAYFTNPEGIYFVEKKKPLSKMDKGFSFLERVTRLELASAPRQIAFAGDPAPLD